MPPLPAPAPDPDFLALQQAFAGQYSLERELGRGGMGVVYLAREVSLDRLVAIKILPPALAARPPLRERFLREARTAAKLSHPNIVPIFRVGEAGAYVYFAMAYVDGETVGQRLRARGALPPAEASRILREAAWALAYAHAQGVVHRDVKPDNILLERGSGRALLTDFGIAHVQETTVLTDEQQVMGTAHFMSPEQAAGESLDGRSDLYALGVVGYLMLTGRLPFDAPTVPAVLAKHLTEAPPPLAAPGGGPVPGALARVVERCLAKDPLSRYVSGEAVAEALAQATQERATLPAPLRVWLQKRDPLMPAYLVWMGVSALGAYGLLVRAVVMPDQLRLDLVWRFLLAGVAPAVPIAAFHLRYAWRVLRLGYRPADLTQALRVHVEQLREESALDVSTVPAWLARVLRIAVYGSWAGLLGFLTVMPFLVHQGMRGPIHISGWVLGAPALLTVVGSVLGVTFPARGLRPGRVAELRLKFWESRPGQWLARVLAGRGGRGAPDQLVQRPTEVAIGLAAAQLFEALPKPLRARLGDLPDVVRQLEAHAQTMRARLRDLDTLLASASTPGEASTLAAGAGGDVAERRESVSAELREARDAAARRLEQTVAALETIRLDLLRLQGGVGDVARLTTALDVARALDDEVRRLAAGHDAAHAVLDGRRELPSPA
ncbi:MAG TPA: serine/threonine-protein kinase [Gemmatimonadaceae bacterium]|nr:serine/threonine-protein kinase [Gemmatimonadaceae bacterium]